jgi:hypothetical protein
VEEGEDVEVGEGSGGRDEEEGSGGGDEEVSAVDHWQSALATAGCGCIFAHMESFKNTPTFFFCVTYTYISLGHHLSTPWV